MAGSARGIGGLPRAFAVLVGGSTLSGVGDGLVAAAMPLLVAAQTRSPALVAGVVAAQRLPWLLLSLHGGALADRVDLRRLLPAIDLLRAVALGVLTGAVALDVAVLPAAFATAVVIGAGDTTVASGLQAAVPRLVPDARLERANTVVYVSQSATEHLTGPAVGGLLFAVAAPLPFALDALTFLGAAALLRRSLPAGPVHAPGGRGIGEDVRAGLRWYRGHAGMRRLTALIATFSLTQGAVLAVLVLLVTGTYGRSAMAFGLVLGAAAVGNLVGSALTERVNRSVPLRVVLLVGGAATGAAYAGLALTRSPWIAGACMAVEGLAVGIVHVAALTYRQRQIPPEMLGRVSAAFRLAVYGAVPVGAVLAGVVAELRDVPAAVGAAAAVQVAASLLLAPRIASDRPVTSPGCA